MNLNMEPIPDSNEGDFLTKNEFQGYLDMGVITPYDGSGYWATESGFSCAHNCFGPCPDWATHVAWFNK